MQSTNSTGPALKPGPVPRRWPHKLRASEIAEKQGSGPRTFWTTAHSKLPGQYTCATARAGTTRHAPASGESAAAPAEPPDVPVLSRCQRPKLKPIPVQAVEPGSRATKAMSIPAVGAFSHFRSANPALQPFWDMQRWKNRARPPQGRRIETVSQRTPCSRLAISRPPGRRAGQKQACRSRPTRRSLFPGARTIVQCW